MSNHVNGFLQHDFIDVIKCSCFEQELVDIAPDAAQLAHDLAVLCGRSLSDGRSVQSLTDKFFTGQHGGFCQCGYSVKLILIKSYQNCLFSFILFG